MEEAIVGISGVSRVVSAARENTGRIEVELETFAGDEAVLNDVVNAIDTIQNFPPPNAEQPKIKLLRWANDVMTLFVSSGSVTEGRLRFAAEDLRDRLLALPGVSHVQLAGTRDKEIRIELGEEELRRHRLQIADIKRAIRRASLNLTFGELRTDAGGVVLQVVEKRKHGTEFKDVPLIAKLDGTVITLGDVASIHDSFVDEKVLTELDGVPVVLVRISASGRQSVKEIRNAVSKFLESYDLPESISAGVWQDRVELTIERLTRIVGNAVIGAVPVVFGEGRASVTNTVQVELRLPAGSPFETTLAAAERFRDAAQSVNDDLEGTSIRSVSIVVGRIVSTQPGDAELKGGNLATVRAHLYDRPVRIAEPSEIERAWRQSVGDVSGLEHVEFVTTRTKMRRNLAYSIRHDDPQELQDAARELRSALASVSGVYGIYDNLSPGKRQLEIELTPAGKAAGLSPALLGAQLRARIHGAEAQRIQRGREEVKVVVRYPAERRRSLSELAGMRIARPGGGKVPLSLVATLTEKQELAELTRIDGKRAAFIEAKADVAVITPIQARRIVEDGVVQELRAKYPGIGIERDGGARDEKRVFETLGALVPLAPIAMYAVMAAFLRSYWKPLVAAAGIPAAFAGAVPWPLRDSSFPLAASCSMNTPSAASE